MSCFMILIIFFLYLANGNIQQTRKEYMIQIKEEWVDLIKAELEKIGLNYEKKVVSNIHLFKVEDLADISPKFVQQLPERFPEKILAVEPREYSRIWNFNDCEVPSSLQQLQWILTRRSNIKIKKSWPYYGMDVQEAWSMGYTGKGVKVAVVDIGVEFSHTDLKKNINKMLSRSFIEGDNGKGNARYLHSYQELDMDVSHGTLAAGLVAAEYGNNFCSAGIAFNATIISLKVFELPEISSQHFQITFPDDHVSQALEYNRNKIDIYLCSFNLDNKFSTSTHHIRTVLREGVIHGRNGKGSIFVFPSGNSRQSVHDCNTTPYTNSIYSITIASVGRGGTKPKYAVPCSCILASTYGEFKTYNGSRKLESPMVRNNCGNFSGTSASAAVASGIIALVLEANFNLTWRDVQYIIVMSSSLERITTHTVMTETNGIGLRYNTWFGFGIMNTTAAVLHALNWNTVPAQINYTISESLVTLSIQKSYATLMSFPTCQNKSTCMRYVEQVRVHIDYQTSPQVEDQLEIVLFSPAKTCSKLFRRKGVPNNDTKLTAEIGIIHLCNFGERIHRDIGF